MEQQQIQLDALWDKVLDEHIRPGNARGVDVWLAKDKVRPLALEDGVLFLSCPTALFVNMIRDRYAESLCAAFSELLEQPVTEVQGRVSGEASREHQRRINQSPAVEKAAPVQDRVQPQLDPAQNWGRGFKQLNDFVVGSCNRLAFDAISRILEMPEDPVNPLFIYSSSGLGKTHLIQGLALAYRDRYPSHRVQYMRCEQFTNDFIAACQDTSDMQAFRVRLRHADLLLLDDIHFLSHGQKQRTKEELFATIDDLMAHGKKIVITSDAAPSDIKYLEQRFVQRFAGGLVAPLDRPDSNMRRGIVRMKAEAHGVDLDEAVVDYIADHITDNVRELEGAVNNIVYMGRSFRRQPDLTLARQALSDMISNGDEPRLKLILRTVADFFELRTEEIMGASRAGACSRARHVAMAVHKLSADETYAAVGGAFGGKSHSAVVYACEQVRKYRLADPALNDFIEDLLLRVRRS